MPDSIILQYRLTRDLWRRFFEAHYGCDRSLKLRYLWGAICIVIACLGFGGFYHATAIAGLLLATGFFGVLSRPLLVLKSLRGVTRHPFFGQELTVTIAPEEIAVRSGTSGYAQPWDNFTGYRHLSAGFLLYHDQHAFFFIPEEVLTAGYARRIEAILQAAAVRKL